MASTWMLRMRYSCFASASSTWCATSVWVAVLFGAKTKSWIRHPHSGRICRSPRAVPMMMRTDSSMLVSYRLSWTAPFGPTEKGNLKPTPRKLVIGFRVSGPLRGRDPHFHHPLAVGAAHQRMALLLFDLQPVGRVALGADQPRGAAGVDGLDDLVPDRFECGQALFGVLVHVRQSPLIRRTGASQLEAEGSVNTLSGGRPIPRGRGFDQARVASVTAHAQALSAPSVAGPEPPATGRANWLYKEVARSCRFPRRAA